MSDRDHDDTRIRRDNARDAVALAVLYAAEDSDRGFLARQVVRMGAETERLTVLLRDAEPYVESAMMNAANFGWSQQAQMFLDRYRAALSGSSHEGRP